MYTSLLKEYKIETTSHFTRFAEQLTSRIPELEKEMVKNKLHVRFKENLGVRVYLDPELFLQSLNNVILPNVG